MQLAGEMVGEMTVTLGGAAIIGDTGAGVRRVSEIAGGDLVLQDMRGVVLPSGADWQLIRSDGVALVDARMVVRMEDGSFVSVQSRGYRHGPAEVLQRLSAGEDVDPDSYYFWLTLAFETSAPRLQWLTRSLCVARAHKAGQAVRHRIFRVGGA
ncbi:MAG TPA: DUF3237 family protein [Sphingomonadales bacterium]